MKAAPFDYVRAADVNEVCKLLAEAGQDERKVIAGGQTLVPLMAMRMARPDMLIDINDVVELAGIHHHGDHIAIGGCTRQRVIERSDLIVERLPLISKAIRNVGHSQTRNRGTIGGSIVHGDPSAELALAALVLDARIILKSIRGEEELSLDGFFEAAMVTNIQPDQLLTEIRIPVWAGKKVGTGFHETASRQGDFAIVAAAAQLELGTDDVIVRAAITVGGVAPSPVRLRSVEKLLTGRPPEAIDQALFQLDDEIDPDTDVHATADYRRRVARALISRAVEDAVDEAQE
jgi:CO/xanthine dehydrogenase FAD-binding subunit